jgi:acyl-coenzyme A thioesterase PaaI-like protein
MSRKFPPIVPSGEYLLHPKRGRTYRPHDVSAENNGGSPRTSTAALLHRGFRARSEALSPPLSENERHEIEARLNKLPVIVRLDGRFDLTSDPFAVCVSIDEVKDYHLGGLGVTAVNGAAISAITDCAVGAVGVVHFPGVRSGTVNLAISFVRPLFGRSVRAFCWVVRRTNFLLFVEVAVLDGLGRVCATASGMVAQVLSKASSAVSRSSEGNRESNGAAPPSSGSCADEE